MLFYERDHVYHLQNRLLSSHMHFCLIRKNNYPIDWDIVVKNKPSKRFDMTGILPNRIPQLMLLSTTKTLITKVWQILFPKLRIFASIYLPMRVFRFNHKNAVTRNDNMINLCSIIPVTNQKVIKYPIFFTWQIF